MEAVVTGSPAAEAGISPGDRVLWLNGSPLNDVIDYQFNLEDEFQELEIERGGRMLTVMLDSGVEEDPGIRFDSAIFDRVRTCRCNCLFCFVDQLPRGLRKSLYLKDDDFRLSFLHGNFITLNNLDDADIERITGQRLSPLYVSVHATDPQVRAAVMGIAEKEAALGLKSLKRLGEAGIDVHAQIVMCPGINDGEVLACTVHDLAAEYAAVASAGIVPVALDPAYVGSNARKASTAGRLFSRLRPVEEEDCRRVAADVAAWQREFRSGRGNGFVYAADEFYLRGGLDLPSLDTYDDMSQYENGIGIAVSFRREAEEIVAPLLENTDQGGRVFLLTGTLAADLVKDVCAGLSARLGRTIEPLVALNRLFGPHVTVAGLLGGRDIIAAAEAAGLDAGDLLVIPHACLGGGPWPRFLDDLHLKDLREALACDILIG